MKILIKTTLVSFLLMKPLFASQLTYKLPDVEKLPNEMQLVWMQDDRAPQISISFVIPRGSVYEPVGRSGSTEVLSLWIEKGFGKLNKIQVSEKIESLAASLGAEYSADLFQLSMSSLKEDFDEVFSLYQDFIQKPQFDLKEYQKLISKLIESKKLKLNSPEALMNSLYSRVMNQGTVYYRGSAESIRNYARLKPQELKNYYQEILSTQGSSFIVVGNLNEAERSKIRAYASQFKLSRKLPRISAKTNLIYQLKNPLDVIVIDREETPQTLIQIGFEVPEAKDPSRIPLMVGNTVFGEYFNSLLNSVIRDQMGLSYGVGSQVTDRLYQSILTISTSTQTRTTKEVLDQILRIKDLAEKGSFEDSEIEKAKNYLKGSYALGLTMPETVASLWLNWERLGIGGAELNRFYEKIETTSAAHVKKTLASVFSQARTKIVLVGNAKEIVKQLKGSSYKNVKVLAQEELLK